MTNGKDEVLVKLSAILRDVIDEPWARELPIGLETSFSQDLELESIEFVSLAERLQTEYGRRVDFTGWLGAMELDRIIGLRVGEVVEFIAQCLSSTSAG